MFCADLPCFRWLRETVRDTRGNADSVGLVCPPTMRKSNRKTEGRRTAKSIFENDPDDKENADAQQTPSKDVFDFKATPGASAKKGLAVNQIESKRRTSSAAGDVALLGEYIEMLNLCFFDRREHKTKPAVSSIRDVKAGREQ